MISLASTNMQYGLMLLLAVGYNQTKLESCACFEKGLSKLKWQIETK